MYLHSTHVAHFTPATVRNTKKGTYIEYKYENMRGDMIRQRTCINLQLKKLKGKREKEQYANQLVAMYNERLKFGWTPEKDRMKAENPKGNTPWREVFVKYRRYLQEMLEYGDLRLAGAQTYASDLNLLEDYITCAPVPDKKMRHKKIVRETERLAFRNDNDYDNDNHNDNRKHNKDRIDYISQLNAEVLRDYLEWAKYERELGPTTLHNYRRWLALFCNWLKDRGYLFDNPIANVAVPDGRKQKSQREQIKDEYIPKEERERIFAYFEQTNKRMLLACYLCYYCMIRPKEIMQLRVMNFHVADNLLLVPGDVSKNQKDGWPTIPNKVVDLMLDLHILECPKDWLIFNRYLLPAPPHTHINNGEALRDRWSEMRKELRIAKKRHFYHLKHTGITDMAAHLLPRQVQLQARHSSLEMTERYLRDAPPKANEYIKNLTWQKS